MTGASLESDWIGTAVYLYGSAEPRSYTLFLDNGQPQNGIPDTSSGLLGKFEGLENKNHTIRLQVTDGASPVVFQEALLTIQLGDDG
jgi:hypothetical protein